MAPLNFILEAQKKHEVYQQEKKSETCKERDKETREI